MDNTEQTSTITSQSSNSLLHVYSVVWSYRNCHHVTISLLNVSQRHWFS